MFCTIPNLSNRVAVCMSQILENCLYTIEKLSDLERVL